MNKIFQRITFIENKTGKEFRIKINLRPFVMKCSISGITESMNIEIEYVPGKLLIETASIRQAFKSSNLTTSFEELTSGLWDYLNENLNPISLRVRCFRNDGKVIDWGVEYSNFR